MNESLHMYLDAGVVRVRLCSGPPWRRVMTELYHGAVGDTGASAESATFASVITRAKRWSLRRDLHVQLGGSHCRFLVVGLPASLRDDHERQAAAGAQMAHQLSLNAGEWTVALERVARGSEVIACALRCDTLALVQRLAQACGAKLASARPFPVTIWNVCGSEDAHAPSSLVVVEDEAFTIFSAPFGSIETITALRHDREPGLVDAELRRLALGCGTDVAPPRLAMPLRLAAMAPLTAIRPETTENPGTQIYADFRDLVLRPSGEDAA